MKDFDKTAEGRRSMLDQAGIMMAQGASIACERITGVNDNMTQPHYHNYYEIYFLEEGGRYQRLQDEVYLLKGGEFMLFSPYIMHYSYGAQNMPFRRIVLYFRSDEVESPELIKLLDESNGMYQTNLKERQVIGRILTELLQEQEQPKAFQKECSHSLLNLLLYHLARQKRIPSAIKTEQQNRIRQIIHYIHNHYNENITLENLADRFYISTFHLCREFKAYTNTTVIQYVNVTRIMNAQRLFMETDKNITAICQETGFSNLTHFNRVFKSVTGMTPSGYRKAHKNLEIYVGGK